MQPFLLETFAQNAISLQMIYAGKGADFPVGWVHEKTVPYAIIAEATNGSYELKCGATRLLTNSGEAWVTAPDMPLRITHHPDAKTGTATRCRYLHFSFTLCDHTDVTRLFKMPMKLVARDCAETGKIIEEFLRADSPEAQHDLCWQVRRQELAFRVLGILCRAAKPSADAPLLVARTQRFRPLADYLRENLAEPVTIADMARVCNLSVSGFHRWFHAHAQASPSGYLKSLRLNHAAQLLLTTDLTLGEIAGRTGFANPFHFSREFKKQYRQPPSDYREETYRRHKPEPALSQK